MTKEEAIKKLGCKEKKCRFLDEDSSYSFCKVIFTEECCLHKENEKPNKETLKAIKEVHEGKYKIFNSVKELFKEIEEK